MQNRACKIELVQCIDFRSVKKSEVVLRVF